MSVIYIALPIAILVVIAAVVAFAWAARSGQFDDLDTPAVRMLHDDEEDNVDDESPRTSTDNRPGGPS